MSLSQRIYYINTLNRKQGTTENFTYELQIPLTEGYNRVSVLNVSIPNTFYLIQEGLNIFIIREGGIDRTITIPPGNYSSKTFLLIVAPLLNAGAPPGWSYTMTIPNHNATAQTGKITYSVTGNL